MITIKRQVEIDISESIELISKAIRNRLSIRFRYCKSKQGDRFGNPHVLYINADTGNLNVDIYQFEGVSSNPNAIPDFRTFSVEYILDVEIIENFSFQPDVNDYNPYSARYKKVFEKV